MTGTGGSTGTGSRAEVTGAGTLGSCCLRGVELLSGVTKRSGKGSWGRLHNPVSAVSVAGSHTDTRSVLCDVFCHDKKKVQN